MNRTFASLVVFAMWLVAPIASATPIAVPPGLSPGDQYRVAFVTSGVLPAGADLESLYNSFVTNQANSDPALMALHTTWTAIVSSLMAAAEDNTLTNPATDPSYPIYNLAGQLVADSNKTLWTTPIPALSAPIEYDEHGALSQVVVFDDTTGSGTVQPYGGAFFYNGYSGATDVQWIESETNTPGQEYPVYGISGVLTVPAPEPSTLILAAIGGLALLAYGRRR